MTTPPKGPTLAHTPGPWEVWKGHYRIFAGVIENDSGGVRSKGGQVADCEDFDGERSEEECRANACLVAAAPDMLDVLQQCQAFLAEVCRPMKPGDNVMPLAVRGMQLEALARAAIQKATGGAR